MENNKIQKRNSFTIRDDFDSFFSSFFPLDRDMSSMKTDIQEKKDKYILEVDLPGYEKKDIELCVDDGYLTISANKYEDSGDKDKKGNYIRRERHYGNCSRSFYIGEINEDCIKANYTQGTLSIEIPKKDLKICSTKKHIVIN